MHLSLLSVGSRSFGTSQSKHDISCCFLAQKPTIPFSSFFFFLSLQVKTREEELQKEDFSTKLGKIEESVELKLLDLTNHGAPNKNKMHGSCRLVFRSKRSASKTGFGGSASKEPVPAVSATEVIRELRMREASLQRELKQLQDECKQRLDGIAERLDGVICISP